VCAAREDDSESFPTTGAFQRIRREPCSQRQHFLRQPAHGDFAILLLNLNVWYNAFMPRFKGEVRTIQKHCPTCGKSFGTFQSQNKLYCSFSCYHQGGNKHCKPTNKATKKCAWCGSPVIRPASNFHSRKVFCNYLCMAEWQSKHQRREAHPRWTGGHGQARGCGWKAARTTARELSGGKCKMCRKPAKEVHHKIPVRCFPTPAEAHVQANLVVLCEHCHPKAEKMFRQKMPLLNLIQWTTASIPAQVS